MKRYYLFLAAFFALAVIVGLSSRRYPTAQVIPVATFPPATAEYEWDETEIEPFLYAVPLGTFTPRDDASIFEWPGASAPVVGSLPGGDTVSYTSEYTFDGKLWLCVKWNVDDDIASWRCTGWVPGNIGTIDRDWEYPPIADPQEPEA
jgi:hypothetical protein